MHVCPLVAVKGKLRKCKLSCGRRSYRTVISSFPTPVGFYSCPPKKWGYKQKWSHLSYYKDALFPPTCKISIQMR